MFYGGLNLLEKELNKWRTKGSEDPSIFFFNQAIC